MAEHSADSELIEAARRVIARRGLAAATLGQIAAEGGVSRMTLHRRGLSKDEIVARLTAMAIDDYRRAMWPAIVSSDPAATRLAQALRSLCEVAERHLGLLAALGSEGDALFHEEGEGEAMTRSPFTEPLERILRDGAQDGTLRADDPVETATVLFNLVGWSYIHLRTGHRWGAERARDTTLRVALHGTIAADQVEAGAEP